MSGMLAATYDAYCSPVTVRDVATPACPADGVLVRVEATGVCRSDWHAWQGHDPVALPHVPGHEFAGVVAEVGPEVTGWHGGERVTAPFVLGCGRCTVCRDGDPQVCPSQRQPGFTYGGSFAELVAVPAADFNLVALPDDLAAVHAAALGCRFATAYRGLVHHARLERGQTLLVAGCGGVGLSSVLIGAGLGARVLAVDTDAAALERARDLGADATVLAADGVDVAAVVQEQFGGAHASIDAVGAPATVQTCVGSLRRRGRHVQVGLLFGDAARSGVPLDRVLAWELEVFGSHGMAAAHYPAMFDFVQETGLDLGALVGRVAPLAEAGAALEAMGRPGQGAGITVLT